MGLQPLAERRPKEGPPGSFQATLVKVHLGLEVRVEEEEEEEKEEKEPQKSLSVSPLP